jgi:hypothetical protein
MTRWEYLFVTCDYARDDWRAQFVNGQEVQDWERGPGIAEWSNQRGAEGWELVAFDATTAFLIGTAHYRLIFKRPGA